MPPAADLVPLQRGVCLLALAAQYPMAFHERALRQQLGELVPTDREIDRILAYLEDKGLITRATATIGGLDLMTVRITPNGLDVAEGRVVEPGITGTTAGKA